MNSAATAFLVAAAAFAVPDWIAVAPSMGAKRVEYIAKPATTALLICLALVLDPADDGQRALFVAALAFSLFGDVFLMLPFDAFAAGLGSFLVAHVAYAVGFAREASSTRALIVSGAVVAVALIPLATRLIEGARGVERRLVLPVAVYIAAIGTMGTLAFASRDARAVAGAALFMTSDSLIGWDRFVKRIPWVRPVIMATYHAGQALLVLSLTT